MEMDEYHERLYVVCVAVGMNCWCRRNELILVSVLGYCCCKFYVKNDDLMAHVEMVVVKPCVGAVFGRI